MCSLFAIANKVANKVANKIANKVPLNRSIESVPAVSSDIVLNDSQKRVYLLLRENPRRTIKDLVNDSSLSNGYIRKILNQLKDLQIITRVGSNKKGYWDVKELNL